MSSANKYKSESIIERTALSAWLRELADAVDSCELPSQAGPVALEGFRSLKVSVRQAYGGGFAVKVGVKFPRPAGLDPLAEDEEHDDEEYGEGALPKYKSLKKHMKQTFRAIGEALAANQLPPELEAASFVADSRLMVSYPGKGDEFYAAYLEKIEAFAAALAAKDLEPLKALHQELSQLKRDCHSRYA